MEIKKSANKNKKKIIIAAILMVILLASGITTAVIIYDHNDTNKNNKSITSNGNKDNEKTSPDNKQQSNSSAKSQNSSTTNNSELPVEDDGKTPKKSEGSSSQNNPTLTGTITVAAVSNGNLTVRNLVDQLVGDKDGTCTLTLTGPNGKNYTNQAKLIDDPQSSTCRGWDIPTSELGGVSGHWTIKIDLAGGGRTGTITKEVDL